MPNAHVKIINAYANDEMDFDALAAALHKQIESDPDSLSDILQQLDRLKTTKPADLPIIQKLQQDLSQQSQASYQTAEGFEERTVVAGRSGRVASHSQLPRDAEEHTKTVIQPNEISSDNDATVVKNTDSADNVLPNIVSEATVVKAGFAPAPGPDDGTRIQENTEATQVAPSTQIESPENKHLEPGSVIKKRFILETLLGEGGMGRVFKARDLRKEEAHDRNPYVAIKVLNDSFKDHPQAFIALQREAKKAQTLAHPNIVNVFDFDRDGDTVYMTMEYLEGDSLDKIIRQHRPNALPKTDAIKIIQGICLGLSYAHKRSIIHSDLKPGNVFVTKDGEVKIFDFGIARAIKTPDTSGEKTLFDAGSLGGLTPAYASCEMFEGEEPDVRDDIYALACIAYELLGGKHPFEKMPAIRAKQNHLTVEKLRNLTRRQNKILSASLAFDRQTRTPSVTQFIDGLTVRFSKTQKIVAALVLIVALAGTLSYDPINKFFRQREVDHYVSQFQTGDPQIIQATLKALIKRPADMRDQILSAAKEPLIAYYEKQAFAHVDTEKGLVDFKGADRYLNIANALYPDSAQISAAKKKLQQREQQLNNELATRLNFHLQQGNLLPDDKNDDLLDVLALAAKLDPDNPLLTDKRIAAEYVSQAQAAADQWDFDKAQQLLSVARQVVPDNPQLSALQQTIDRQQKQYLSRQQELVGNLDAKAMRRQVESLLKKPFESPAWSSSIQTYLKQLEAILPTNDRWLREAKQQTALFYFKRAENLRRQGKFGEARATLLLAEKFDKTIPGLRDELASIQQAESRSMKEQQAQAQQQQLVTAKQQLLREANNNNVQKAESLLEKLTVSLGKKDTFITTEAPNAIAAAYVRLANNALQRGNAHAASQWVSAGLKIAPKHKELAAIKKKIPTKTSDACELKYAGYGERFTCFDSIGAGKGPALVVIPAMENSKAFAIGKYEVSIDEFNVFCRDTKKCSPLTGESDLPVTKVGISGIKDYLQWLSARTNATYRLPTRAEWQYAAKATAQPSGKDFNCRVTIGNTIVRGNALLTVNSGKKNSWGLFNYIGNVQELVFDPPNTLTAMGGAYQDPLAKCNISFSRNHDGSADPITGFRVLREM